jgi:hypothetical protein
MRLDSKYFDRIRTSRKREPEPEQAPPTCQWDGCDKKGVHRAPVGRNAEGQFFLFCFEHVKDYNKGYNYFSGLSDGEIARYQKEAITGHRPTWTVGVNKAAKDSPLQSEVRSGAYTRVRDPFGFVKDSKGSGPRFPTAAFPTRLGHFRISCPGLKNARSDGFVAPRFRHRFRYGPSACRNAYGRVSAKETMSKIDLDVPDLRSRLSVRPPTPRSPSFLPALPTTAA